jgi:signal transduction histidine kinase
LKWQLDEKNIDLVLPENPPTLICDRTRLYQLFSNLIGNAIHHMNRPSAARIEVELETISDGWQITVSDNGQGIPVEDHDRIFRAFEAVHRPSSNGKSSGLGLAIVKKIVESHSGRVWVESEPGAGACFIVQLPAP